MKVGTDGLLLATSTPIASGEKTVLDIGSGTGLIALVISQRDPAAEITAIEIDREAAKEAKFNFKSSPFASRLQLKHLSLEDYVLSTTEKFDLIVCNPPFFEGMQAKGKRGKARNAAMLPAEELIEGAEKLLSKDGQFSVIIPYQNEKTFIQIAREKGLHPFEILNVRGRKGSKLIRSIIHFSRKPAEHIINQMHIENDQRHQYSDAYVALTKDFLTIFD